MTTATTPEQADAIVNKAAVIAYKPIGLVFGVLGGLLANLVFGQVWKRVSDAPGFSPTVTETGMMKLGDRAAE